MVVLMGSAVRRRVERSCRLSEMRQGRLDEAHVVSSTRSTRTAGRHWINQIVVA